MFQLWISSRSSVCFKGFNTTQSLSRLSIRKGLQRQGEKKWGEKADTVEKMFYFRKLLWGKKKLKVNFSKFIRMTGDLECSGGNQNYFFTCATLDIALQEAITVPSLVTIFNELLESMSDCVFNELSLICSQSVASLTSRWVRDSFYGPKDETLGPLGLTLER